MAKFVKYTQADLNKLLEAHRNVAVISCRFLREFVGGQPATDKGLEAFIQHHLGIDPLREGGGKKGKPTNPEFIAAFERIKKEELGKAEEPGEGELVKEKVYGVNNIRCTDHGLYVGDHQIKAVVKQAASRLGFFNDKKGSKGDVAEMGTVLAHGASLLDPARPWEVYLLKDKAPITTRKWVTMRGSVNTAQGTKSIQYEAEVAPEGSEFEFEFRWANKKMTRKMLASSIGAATAIGLGSCLSLGYGRFEVTEMSISGAEEDEE